MNLNKIQRSELIIWLGIVFGILDWLTNMIYSVNMKFSSSSTKGACIIFIMFQPLSYLVLFSIYILNHKKIKDKTEKREKLCLSVPYALL